MNCTYSLRGVLVVLLCFGTIFLVGCQQGDGTATKASANEAHAGYDHAKEEKPNEQGHSEEGHAEGEQSQEGVVKLTPEALKQSGLEFIAVERVAGKSLSVTGTVEAAPNGSAQVTPRAPGRIVRLYASIGDAVQVGQPLADVSATELEAAQRTYRLGVARCNAAQNTLTRQRRLAQLGEFGNPRVEEARGAAASASGAVSTAQSELARATAELVEAQVEKKTKQAALEQQQAQANVTKTRRDRAERLLKEELISLQETEQTRANFASAAANVRAAQAEVAQAEAHITSAQADKRVQQSKLAQAQQQTRIAQQALVRAEAVFKGGFLTSREIVEAEAALEQARIEANSARDAVRLLGGTPGSGGNSITIKSPIAGQIIERGVNVGQSVGASDALFRIVNLRTVSALLSVFPADLSAIRVGQSVQVRSEAASGRAFRGRVVAIGTADAATGAVGVRVNVESSGLLRPSGFVRAQIQTAGDSNAQLVVPAEAVQEVEGRQVVFVAGDETGEYRAVPVTVGEEVAGGKLVLRGGVRAGQKIVGKNAFTLKAAAMQGELGEGHAH